MLLDIELRHLYSVIVLAEEMHSTRAAHRLRIAQPCFSKRIQQIERSHGVLLFERDKSRIVELTGAGRIFVDEARLAIFHAERALDLARASSKRTLSTVDHLIGSRRNGSLRRAAAQSALAAGPGHHRSKAPPNEK